MNNAKALEQLMASNNQVRKMNMMKPPSPQPMHNEDFDFTVTTDDDSESEEAESNRIDESRADAESIKLAFMNRLSKSIDSYENSFWFENSANQNPLYSA